MRHWWILLTFLGAAGCSGSAKFNLVSLNMSAIDPPPPKVWEYDAQECYWWTDEDGDLNISMKCTQRNIFLGKLGDFDLYFSFALKEPPAGSGRDYNIRQRETRSIGIYALQSFRFTSYAGIIDALTGSDKTYSGSFRMGLTTHTELSMFNLMPQKPGNVLCFGKYHAVHDPVRGRAIRDFTEAEGWERPARQPKATTRPASYVQR
jgi:hypothetical protein